MGLVSVLRDISLKKELERQRADFLAILTHDIKNPIHAILGCAELLWEDVQPSYSSPALTRRQIIRFIEPRCEAPSCSKLAAHRLTTLA